MSVTRNQAARRIACEVRKRLRIQPSLALILGSGFQSALENFEILGKIPYKELPGFPALHVEGHPGQWVAARFKSLELFVLCGRPHFYEGHSMEAVTLPVSALAAAGVRDLFLTNAAGGIKSRLRAGDLMAIKDHINLIGSNPLRGLGFVARDSFVDLTEVYDRSLRTMLLRAAKRAKTAMHSGVYLGVSGPSYETPAEIRAFAKLGADAVGMSTIPEAVTARAHGMRVLALSCITNLAAGRNRRPLSHQDVLETGRQAERSVRSVISQFMDLYLNSLSDRAPGGVAPALPGQRPAP